MKAQQFSFAATGFLPKEMRRFLTASTVTLFTLLLLTVFLMPFAYMTSTALKTGPQLADPGAPLWPAVEQTHTYEGEEYPVYKVPTDQGVQEWALVDKGREESQFIDTNNPEAGLILWEGRWRTLERVWLFSPRWQNFVDAWNGIDFPRLFFNTLVIAVTGTIGTLISCSAVAYGFSRFRFPGRNILLLVLIATIILPRTVTMVPLYAAFVKIGWVGTWLPLIVPHFFANAYNVFLMRQFFMTIPVALDEAAAIDGAGPIRRLISIILPQSIPVLLVVTVNHMVFAWNDYFDPLLYLSTTPELQPISVGIQKFNWVFDQQPEMVQATSLLGLVLPVLLFFVAQRHFMGGVVFTGVEK
ncbi:MAG: carbohydrate ABC transporter permease [Anaerolineae bacterium]|jgi:multiple sugar transport system permease protein